jgi:Flp pilus assembly protein TadG
MMARSLERDESGNFAVLAALTMVPVLAGAALAIDGANAYRQTAHMQAALDSAVIAATIEYGSGATLEEMTAVADDVFRANFFESRFVGIPLDEAAYAEGVDLVEISLVPGMMEDEVVATVDLDYSPLFWKSVPFAIDTRSVAARMPDLEACILALAKTAPRAFEVSGSASVDLSGCTVTSNSRHAESIYVDGSASLYAECLYAAGKIAIDPLKVELACEAYREGTGQMRDPFRDKVLPRPGSFVDLAGCGQNFVVGGGGNGDCNGTGRTPNGNTSGYAVTLKPGTYSELEIRGAVDLEPGNYIIDGGRLKLSSQAVLSGAEVTFFLINGASLEIAGGATFSLSPATAGDWAGFVLVAEAGNTGEAIINGNSNSTLTGIIYMPDATIEYSGNSSTSGECIRIIAQQITMIGNARFAMDCDPALANIEIRNPGAIRLIE